MIPRSLICKEDSTCLLLIEKSFSQVWPKEHSIAFQMKEVYSQCRTCLQSIWHCSYKVFIRLLSISDGDRILFLGLREIRCISNMTFRVTKRDLGQGVWGGQNLGNGEVFVMSHYSSVVCLDTMSFASEPSQTN